MRFRDLLATALGSLRQRLFRTSLTVLGVVIGTMAVVVMLSLGFGMSASMTAQLDSASLRRVQVHSVPQAAVPGQRPLKMDGSAIAALEAYPGVDSIIPVFHQSVELRVGRHMLWVQIAGMPLSALEDLPEPIADGALPSSGGQLELLYGSTVEQMVWDEATQMPAEVDWMGTHVSGIFMDDMTGLPLGQEAPSGDGVPTPGRRITLPTAGVLALPEAGWSMSSQMVYADLDTLVRFLQTNFPGVTLPQQSSPSATPARGDFIFNEIQVMAASPADAEALLDALLADGYGAWAEIEWIRQAEQQALVIQAVLGGIGFISLLVAAIGIANTMLMSVYERTREIGVMKVLGAALSDIRGMFLVESAAIGFFGGVLGVLFSLLVSSVLNSVLGQSFGLGMGGTEEVRISLITVPLVIAAVVGSTLIGTISGFLPAQRAMRLSPLDAIRSQ